MSAEFWLNLLLAVAGLFAALALIRSWKRGLIRDWRAKSLRQRLIPVVESMLESLVGGNVSGNMEPAWQDLTFFRHREKAEELYRKSSSLSQEERAGLAKFLSAISSLQAKTQSLGETDEVSLLIRTEQEEAILNGQRIVQDMREMGL